MNQEITLNDFFSQFQKKQFKKNSIILKPSDLISKIFFLEQGYVRSYLTSDSGQEFTLNIFDAGTFFPISAAISNRKINRYYFHSLTPIIIRSAPKNIVINFLNQNHQQTLILLKRISSGLEGMLERIEGIIHTSARQKIASTLLLLAKKYGEKITEEKICISFPHTHEMLSTLAGLTRETTSLELQKLQQAKIISRISKKTCVINISLLKEKTFAI